MPDQTSTLPDFDRLWNYAKPSETEQAFRGILGEAEASGNTSYLVSLLTQIARCEGLQGKFTEAHATLDRAEAILVADRRPVASIRLLLERGRVLNSSGHPEESIPLFLEAWELARSVDDEVNEPGYAVDAAHMLGIVAPEGERLGWNQTALEFALASGDERALRWLGSLYNNIGWTLHQEGDYVGALDNFQKYVAWSEKKKLVRGAQIANWMVARTLRSMGKIDDALDIHWRLLMDVARRIGEPDGYLFEEIGECLLARGESDKAAPYFRDAYYYHSQDREMTTNDPARLERLKQLGGDPEADSGEHPESTV